MYVLYVKSCILCFWIEASENTCIIKRNICNVKKPAIRSGSRTVIAPKMELFVTVS